MPPPLKLSLPTVSIPTELQNSLKRVLTGHPKKRLVSDGQSLYQYLISRRSVSRVQENRRRRGLLKMVPANVWDEETKSTTKMRRETTESVLRYGEREAMAYAACRLNAIYGSTLKVLNEIAVRDERFQPEAMMDFGSGLGTAVWAAHRLWGETLYELQTVDTSSEMGDMARKLRQSEDGKEMIPGVHFRQYLPTSSKVQYDLVTACYTLGDIPSINIKKLSLEALWRKTKKYLVLMELGNNEGFQNIIEARDVILNAQNWSSEQGTSSLAEEDEEKEKVNLDGHVFAPCPHSLTCPLATAGSDTTVAMGTRGGPCRFGQRVSLDYSNRDLLKHKGHSTETFSYVILKKGKPHASQEQYSRLLLPAKKRARHVLTQQCCPDGEVRQIIYTKSKHRDIYRECRESSWGDILSHDLPTETTPPQSDTDDVSQTNPTIDQYSDTMSK